MNNECTICQHRPHDGHRCDWPITKTISDHVGYAGPPTYLTRTIIDRRCMCGTVDALMKELGLNEDDITPFSQ